MDSQCKCLQCFKSEWGYWKDVEDEAARARREEQALGFKHGNPDLYKPHQTQSLHTKVLEANLHTEEVSALALGRENLKLQAWNSNQICEGCILLKCFWGPNSHYFPIYSTVPHLSPGISAALGAAAYI